MALMRDRLGRYLLKQDRVIERAEARKAIANGIRGNITLMHAQSDYEVRRKMQICTSPATRDDILPKNGADEVYHKLVLTEFYVRNNYSYESKREIVEKLDGIRLKMQARAMGEPEYHHLAEMRVEDLAAELANEVDAVPF